VNALRIASAAACLIAAIALAQSQAPTRVRGTITAIEGTPLGMTTVKAADGKLIATRLQVSRDGVRPPQ